MSRIRANTITNQNANGAPNFPDGLTVSGVVTATVSSSTLGSLSVTGNATIGGTLGIGGTLTYEDVTNIDSVGIITARSGIQIGVGGTIGSSGGGIVTYFGDGGQLTGISVDSTKIETGNTKVETVDTGTDGHVKVTTEGTERLRIATDGKLSIDRTHASATTGNHPALDIDTHANGTAGATFATGIDFSVAGVHKKRLVVTNVDSSAGTGDWIFYRDNGNNVGMQISSSGNVTKPNNVMFRAYYGGAAVTFNQGDVTFPGVDNNIGNCYNNSNGRFTAPVNGVYLFYVGWYVSSHSNHRVALRINGSEYTRPYISGYNTGQNSNTVNPSAAQFLPLSANDYVNVWTDGAFTPYGSHFGWGGYLLG